MGERLLDFQGFNLRNDKFESPVCCGLVDKSEMARRRKGDVMGCQIVRAAETGQSFANTAA